MSWPGRRCSSNTWSETMIEVPRAALRADVIAETAEFFSFGTNDLTQTTLGMSRDDSGSFLPEYQDLEIINQNPFASIDQAGVGLMVEIATEKGRSKRKDLKLGICGEHGGDPNSITFFHNAGLDYVSCSPPRVPVARLARRTGKSSQHINYLSHLNHPWLRKNMFEVRDRPRMVERALLIGVNLPGQHGDDVSNLLLELADLVNTLDIEVMETMAVTIRKTSSTLFHRQGESPCHH